MTMLKIPMNEWSKSRLFLGWKVCTSRTKKYGSEGDTFDGGTEDLYQLMKIMKLPLWFVRDFLWQIEGANSPEEFEKVWRDIHPKKGFDGEQEVWVHFFKNPNPGIYGNKMNIPKHLWNNRLGLIIGALTYSMLYSAKIFPSWYYVVFCIIMQTLFLILFHKPELKKPVHIVTNLFDKTKTHIETVDSALQLLDDIRKSRN